jgi:uncharacterized protein YqhQ
MNKDKNDDTDDKVNSFLFTFFIAVSILLSLCLCVSAFSKIETLKFNLFSAPHQAKIIKNIGTAFATYRV